MVGLPRSRPSGEECTPYEDSTRLAGDLFPHGARGVMLAPRVTDDFGELYRNPSIRYA
jgi:hypothetical protein